MTLKTACSVGVVICALAASPLLAQDSTDSTGEGPGRTSAQTDLNELLGSVNGGLTADQVALRAVSQSAQVARAEAAVLISEAGAERAWQAVIPRIDLSARYTRINETDSGSIGAGQTPEQQMLSQQALMGVDDPEARLLIGGILEGLNSFDVSFAPVLNQFALRLQVSYPLSDLFFQILPGYEAAKAATEVQRLTVLAQKAQIDFQARETYYNYLRARGAAQVAASALAQAEAHRTQVQALVDTGTAPRVELMRLDAQIAAARVGLARAEGGVALASAGLRALMRDENDSLVDVGGRLDTELTPPSTTIADLVAQAESSRLELRALRAAIGAQESALDARRGARYPHLGVSAGLDVVNPNTRSFPQEDKFDLNWDISAVLSWSPNDLFSANAQISEGESQVSQTRADLAGLQSALRVEVTRGLTDFRAAKTAYDAASFGLEAAAEAYRVRDEQLRAGVVVAGDLIDAEAELTRARLQALDSLIDLHLGAARLRHAIGDDVAPLSSAAVRSAE